MLYNFLTICIVVVAIILILIVLVQNSKGGGLDSQFSASNQIMGVRRTTDFLEKATWTLIGVIVVLCVLTATASKDHVVNHASEIATQVEQNAQPTEPQFNDAATAPEAVPAESTPAEENK